MTEFALPDDLPFPPRCPQCQGVWVKTPWAYAAKAPLARELYTGTVYCARRHPYHQELTAEELWRFVRAMGHSPPGRSPAADPQDVRELLPPGGGPWGDLSDVDPTWVYDRCRQGLQAATLLALTAPERGLVAEACHHLPADLRPSDLDAADLRWVDDDDGFVLVRRIDEHVTELVSFKYDIAMATHTRMDSRTTSATVALYRHGEKMTLPW